MNYEQFTFWLSGYISSLPYSNEETEKIIETIKRALSIVKESSQTVHFFATEDHQ